MEDTNITSLKMRRDRLLQELWTVLNKLFAEVGSDGLTDHDLSLWTQVTSHPGFQRKLKGKEKLQ
jgi:hypothetical protein